MRQLLFARPSPAQLDLALLALRVMAGIIFIVHGWQKVSMGIGNVAGFFAQTGAPLPALTAPLVTTLELAGGAMLVLGALTRPLAIMFAIDMFSATMLVHRKNGFATPGGMEFTMLLCVVAIALVLTGAGAYSVDGAINARTSPGTT